MLRIFLLAMFLTSQAVASEPTIHPEDAVFLEAAGIPKDDAEIINDVYRVDQSGSINLSYLGKVIVSGLTAVEAARRIDEAYVSRGVFTRPSVTISIEAPNASAVQVQVNGPVQHPGRCRIKTPATIEEALAQAGGWNGSGELGIPGKGCNLTHYVEGKPVHTFVQIRIDRKTKQIQVVDQAWKDYHLASGDEISLGEVVF